MDGWGAVFPNENPPKEGYVARILRSLEPRTETEESQPAEPTLTETLKDKQPEPPLIVDEPSLIGEPTIEDINKAEQLGQIPKNELTAAIITGKITKENIVAVFKIENQVIKTAMGEECQLDAEAIDLAAGLGVAPINRLLAPKMDGNLDLYLFIAAVAWMHVPIIMKLAKKQKWFQKKKQEETQNGELVKNGQEPKEPNS